MRIFEKNETFQKMIFSKYRENFKNCKKLKSSKKKSVKKDKISNDEKIRKELKYSRKFENI